jgi:protein-disulfide isomerase
MISEFGTAVLTPPLNERDHVQGLQNAKVTLVEYGDYECPHCGNAHGIVKGIQKHLHNQLRFAFRNFPLTKIHPHAEHAAEAAEAAGAQGMFWEMHDMLFENQDRLDDIHLPIYAGRLHLDVDRFMRELTEHTHEVRVREDFMSGVRSGVNGTPTFFINGIRHDDSYDGPTLLAAIIRAGG